MKRCVMLPGLLLSVVMIFLASCNKDADSLVGNGHRVTKTYSLPAFEGLSLGDRANIVVVQGAKQQVSIAFDENLLPYVQPVVDHGILKIRHHLVRHWRSDDTLQVTLTLPDLKAVSVDDQAHISVNDFNEPTVSISADDSSRVDWTGKVNKMTVKADDASKCTLKIHTTLLTLHLDDSAFVRLVGDTDDMIAQLGDASRLKGRDFLAHHATITMDDASVAAVGVADSLRYDLSDASKLDYLGSPTIRAHRLSDSARVNFSP